MTQYYVHGSADQEGSSDEYSELENHPTPSSGALREAPSKMRCNAGVEAGVGVGVGVGAAVGAGVGVVCLDLSKY
eukprot:SAG31_NODE_27360_length_427_cov_0.789634_1_plen_75_part_00